MDKTALYSISYGLYVIGTRMDGKDIGCVVDAFIQSTSTPVPTVILCSIQENQTNEALKKTGEFTVSVIGANVDPFVIGNFGFQSGRNVDKWANVEHRHIDGLPVLEQAVAYYRCKITEEKELSTHTVFFCEVTDALKGEASEVLTYGAYQTKMKIKAQKAFEAYKSGGDVSAHQQRWVCSICGYAYEGEVPFEELADTWTCPLCGAPKSAFVKEG